VALYLSPQLDHIGGQSDNWAKYMILLPCPPPNSLHRGYGFPSDPFLWTPPVESERSMVVFITLVAFPRLRTMIQLLQTFGLSYTYYGTHTGESSFFLAEFFLVRYKFPARFKKLVANLPFGLSISSTAYAPAESSMPNRLDHSTFLQHYKIPSLFRLILVFFISPN
jgi:hypothetical protein